MAIVSFAKHTSCYQGNKAANQYNIVWPNVKSMLQKLNLCIGLAIYHKPNSITRLRQPLPALGHLAEELCYEYDYLLITYICSFLDEKILRNG